VADALKMHLPTPMRRNANPWRGFPPARSALPWLADGEGRELAAEADKLIESGPRPT